MTYIVQSHVHDNAKKVAQKEQFDQRKRDEWPQALTGKTINDCAVNTQNFSLQTLILLWRLGRRLDNSFVLA